MNIKSTSRHKLWGKQNLLVITALGLLPLALFMGLSAGGNMSRELVCTYFALKSVYDHLLFALPILRYHGQCTWRSVFSIEIGSTVLKYLFPSVFLTAVMIVISCLYSGSSSAPGKSYSWMEFTWLCLEVQSLAYLMLFTSLFITGGWLGIHRVLAGESETYGNIDYASTRTYLVGASTVFVWIFLIASYTAVLSVFIPFLITVASLLLYERCRSELTGEA